jgi:1,4-alpha-glucan branching enzyme
MHKGIHHHGSAMPKKALSFNKVFRWEPTPQAPSPSSVEVAGSFSEWQAIPLKRDPAGHGWHLNLSNIPGNCTHRYMLLVDGQPANDPHADGLAIPETAVEKACALTTARGPRLFMLFSQTK